MDTGDDYWGLYRDYYKDPFPHSLLRTRQSKLQSTQKLKKPAKRKVKGLGLRFRV